LIEARRWERKEGRKKVEMREKRIEMKLMQNSV
jgi:hypothetical protein